MDSRNIPYRSEVARWTPDDLSDYFRKLNFKDCEKVARKHSMTGQRFLNMSENDIQKFPKLRMPILIKLSQEINRNEERKSFFPKRTHAPRVPENTELRHEEIDGWSSFEDSDDYESPDELENEDCVDYETPNEDGGDDENEADYEPPPSNDEDLHRNAIFPSKSLPTNSQYIDRPATVSKTLLQPPVPPQRPGSSPVPAASGGRGTGQLPSYSPSSNGKNIRSFKPPAPSIDRRNKPPLDWSGPPFDRDLPGAGRRGFAEMPLAPKLRYLGEELAKIQKPPVPSTDKKNNPTNRKKPPLIKNSPVSERRADMEDGHVPHRPVPQPPSQSPFFNTFPSKLPSKQTPLLSKAEPEAYTESTISSSGTLPSHLQSSNICRSFSKGPADGRPPLPIPNRQPPKLDNEEGQQSCKNQTTINQEWYAADITRPKAEVALRNINQDGTFLVRDSSRRTLEQPYVLMVLYNDKVYNIQIRYREEDKSYFLGTSLKANEDFTSVNEIIENFKRMPLRLIDGKDRCSRKQCMLTYPAGFL
ncbi:lymphocyte cytosolic protein 2 [Hemicordylus capensis]|uniref:lymphocyte cytosolic protein 2 n=1 Tax=Hemicordylus capensis TaxID=884348 RepID=UPI00230492E3|nr:lymphocyte cytosolic protein 2 [Hemicordylus capensis]